MTAEPPAPRPAAAGLTEYPQVVQTGVAATFAAPVDGPALDIIEHVVQPDDGGDGDVPGGGEPGGDQLVGQALLSRPLGAEGQAAVVGGGVEPAPALGVGPGVRAGRSPAAAARCAGSSASSQAAAAAAIRPATSRLATSRPATSPPATCRSATPLAASPAVLSRSVPARSCSPGLLPTDSRPLPPISHPAPHAPPMGMRGAPPALSCRLSSPPIPATPRRVRRRASGRRARPGA